MKRLAVALGLVLAGVGFARAAGPFTLASTSFKDTDVGDVRFAGALKDNPNCVGQNVSPQLSWSNVPDGTRSLALLLIDPEGAGGRGVAHFVAYNIAPTVTGFDEGELARPSGKYVGGKSTQGLPVYTGPCTPPNTTYHHYTFVLIATDLDPTLPPGLTRDELTAKLQGHAKGAAGIMFRFKHP